MLNMQFPYIKESLFKRGKGVIRHSLQTLFVFMLFPSLAHSEIYFDELRFKDLFGDTYRSTDIQKLSDFALKSGNDIHLDYDDPFDSGGRSSVTVTIADKNAGMTEVDSCYASYQGSIVTCTVTPPSSSHYELVETTRSTTTVDINTVYDGLPISPAFLNGIFSYTDASTGTVKSKKSKSMILPVEPGTAIDVQFARDSSKDGRFSYAIIDLDNNYQIIHSVRDHFVLSSGETRTETLPVLPRGKYRLVQRVVPKIFSSYTDYNPDYYSQDFEIIEEVVLPSDLGLQSIEYTDIGGTATSTSTQPVIAAIQDGTALSATFRTGQYSSVTAELRPVAQAMNTNPSPSGDYLTGSAVIDTQIALPQVPGGEYLLDFFVFNGFTDVLLHTETHSVIIDTRLPELTDVRHIWQQQGELDRNAGRVNLSQGTDWITSELVTMTEALYYPVELGGGIGTCTIPAGSVACSTTISGFDVLGDDTPTEYHYREYFLQDSTESIESNKLSSESLSDTEAPIIVEFTIDPQALKVGLKSFDAYMNPSNIESQFGMASHTVSVSGASSSTLAATSETLLPSDSHNGATGGSLTSDYQLSSLPEGQYTVTVESNDKFGNQTIQTADVFIDQTAPTLVLTHNGNQVIAAETLEPNQDRTYSGTMLDVVSFGDFLITPSDNDSAGPALTLELLDGSGPAIPLSITDTGSGYTIDPFLLMPSEMVGTRTLRLTATDTRGLKSILLQPVNYMPPLTQTTQSLSIPASVHAFSRAGDEYAYGLMTDPFKFGDVVISGLNDVYVRIPAEAPVGVLVNGYYVEPGTTTQVASSYDFTASGGVINLPISAISDSPLGVNITELYVLSTGALHEERVQITIWEPEAEFVSDAWEIRQLVDPIDIMLSSSGGLGMCDFTTDLDYAMSQDIYSKPASCFVEFTALPDQAELSNVNEMMIQGSAYALGEQMVTATISLVDTDGTKVLLKEVSRPLTVVTGESSITLEPKDDISNVIHTVGEIQTNMSQVTGPDCTFSMYEIDARQAAQNGSGLTCFFEWVNLPEGLSQYLNYSTPYLKGTVMSADPVTLSWKATAYSKAGDPVIVTEQDYDITPAEPAPPVVNFVSSVDRTETGTYKVTTDRSLLGQVEVTDMQADFRVTVKRDGVIIDEREILSGNYYTNGYVYNLYDEESDVWDEVVYDIHADYLATERPTDLQIDTVSLPVEDVKPVLSSSSTEVTNLDVLTFTASIRNVYKPSEPYDQITMGEWEIRPLYYNQSDRSTTPAGEWQAMTAGSAEMTVDVSSYASERIMISAEARLISSRADIIEVRQAYRPIYYYILDGSAVESTLAAYRLEGKAPFTSSIDVRVDDRYKLQAMGDVIWELSFDGGTTWTEEDNNSTNARRFVKTWSKGLYHVRARVLNKYSGLEYTTSMVEINSYYVPTVTIAGPTNVFLGGEASFTASPRVIGKTIPSEEFQYFWSVDKGESWAEGSETLSLQYGEVGLYPIWVKTKHMDAPDSDRSYYTRKQGAYWREVMPPVIRLSGPKRAEEGKPGEWNAKITAPYRNMDIELNGYFVLPDGSEISGETLTYTPTIDDKNQGTISIQYQAAIVGFEDQGATAKASIPVSVWEYVWPTWSMSSKSRTTYAPSDLILRIGRNTTGEIDGLTAVWDYPTSMQIIKKISDLYYVMRVTEAGEYPVTITISDNRGNQTILTENITFNEPPEYTVDARVSKSNSADRAPLGMVIRPIVTGGHPEDRILDYVYSVNGTQVSVGTQYISLDLLQGTHLIELSIVTKHGKTGTYTLNQVVNANVPPSCTGSMKESRSSWTYYSSCSDADGRIMGYAWTINGEPYLYSTSRITVSKNLSPSQPGVTLSAKDDSGEYSEPISIE